MSEIIGKEIQETSKSNNPKNFQTVDAQKNIDNKNTLLGNKRERVKDIKEEKYLEINTKKTCDFCKNNIQSEFLEIDQSTPNQNIIDFIAKRLKEQNLLKSLTENLDKLFTNKIKPKKIICEECFFNNFEIGGFEKNFFNDKSQNNFTNIDNINNIQEQKLNQIREIYSINLNLAIKSLKNLKDEYSDTIDKTNKVFENAGLRMMLSNNKETFQELKKNIDKSKQDLKMIKDKFESLIKDLTCKEENKSFFIENIYSNNDLNKEKLMNYLKNLKDKVELSLFNNINEGTTLNDENNKNIDEGMIFNLEKEQNNIQNDKDNNDKNNIYNKINTGQYMNLQNIQKPNMSEQFLLNNIDKADILKTHLLLTQNNFAPESTYLSQNLGLFPNFNPQLGRMPNNILINNLFPSQSLNSQLIGNINNNQINSFLPNNTNNSNNLNNNNLNDNNNKNFNLLNNLSYIPFPAYLPKPNFPFNNSNDSLKDLENIYAMKNMNQNNFFNNTQISQNPPLSIPPISLNNLNPNPSSILSSNLGNNLSFTSPPLSLYNNILNIQGNIQGNNGTSNLSQQIKTNNSNIEQNNINQLNLIKRNLELNSNNNKGININNLNNINLNNLNNINGLNGINGNDLRNNNLNNNTTLNSEGESKIKLLFDTIAENKSKNSMNNDNIKNNINLNNNNKLETNNNNNISQQLNSDSVDKKSSPLNNLENNNTINNNTINNNITKINTENNNIPSLSNNINILEEKKGNENIKEKEQNKKDN